MCTLHTPLEGEPGGTWGPRSTVWPSIWRQKLINVVCRQYLYLFTTSFIFQGSGRIKHLTPILSLHTAADFQLTNIWLGHFRQRARTRLTVNSGVTPLSNSMQSVLLTINKHCRAQQPDYWHGFGTVRSLGRPLVYILKIQGRHY